MNLTHGFNGYIARQITPETFVDQVQAFIPTERVERVI
jgi:hypothetical protein